MGHLPVVLLVNAVTVSLVAFGVLALAAALLLVVGAARRRSRTHTVVPTRPPTAAPRIDEESPTMADDPHDGAPSVLADTPHRTNGTGSTDSPAPATSGARARPNGRSRRRATAPTTTPAEAAPTATSPAATTEPAATATTPAEPAATPAEPAEVTGSVPGRTRVRPEPAPEPTADPTAEPTPEATSEAAPARKARGTRAAKTGMKAATTGEAASPATRSSRSRARTTAAEAPARTAVPATRPTPPVTNGPAGGRFLAPRRGRVKALLEVLEVPGAVVRPRDDVAAVLTRFYADAVRAHDAVHVVQLTDAARADVGVELHAAGHIVGDGRSYRDLTTDADPEAPHGRGLHGLRRPRVDGVAVKALRGASSAVLVVDSRRSRPAAVADAAAMLDGLGVAVRGVVVWKGRIPRA